MEKIFIKDAKTPRGHYSPGVKSNGMVYVSGQLAVCPFTGERSTGDITCQTKLALENVQRILESAGSCVDKIVKLNVFISDISYWDKVNDVCKEFFGEHRPARIVAPVPELHYGLLIEIDAVAEA